MTADGPLHVARSLHLYAPDGTPIQAETAWFRDAAPECRLQLQWQAWERVAASELFGVDEETLLSDPVPDCDVVLDASYTSTDAPYPDAAADLKNRLADPGHPLRQTSSWSVETVRQSTPLADESDVAESVFDTSDDGPRPHVTELSVRRESDE